MGIRGSAHVIGAGPAGLMAAEVLAEGGADVHVHDAMATAGRKFLLAGKGGLNLTHSEPLPDFVARYGARAAEVASWLAGFGPAELRAWGAGLGVETFVGTSGRVFPRDLKAAPLLRAWLHRLRTTGVRFHMRQRWLGWADDDTLRFATPEGEQRVGADATVLALGGASWPQLGSDAAWLPWLQARGVAIAALKPANCGFDADPPWSEHFRDRHAGQPIKPVVVECTAADGSLLRRQGEFVATETGVEGSLVYAVGAALRDAIEREGHATLRLDLLPDRTLAQVQAEIARPRGSRSLATHLKSRLGLHGVKTGLLHELLPRDAFADAARLAAAIKALPLRLGAARPLAEAISTAGGVAFDALDESLMLRAVPGVFCAGEMLDWEAPTGGYLLTASFASGRVAGRGALARLGIGP
jgi:uncharacterized flavoprotein (TIGR03862 family)